MYTVKMLCRTLFSAVLLFGVLAGSAWANDEADARAALDRFVAAWLVEQDISKAVTMVDAGPELETWVRGLYDVPAGVPVDGVQWVRKFLAVYLHMDHGSITALAGHANPTRPGYGKVPECAEDIPAEDRMSKDAGKEAEIIQFGKVKGIEMKAFGDYAGALSLPSAPRDAVIVLLKKRGGVWKIVGLIGM